MSNSWILTAAELVKTNSAEGILTTKKILLKIESEEDKDFLQLCEQNSDIRILSGKKEEYLYHSKIMNDNYAQILFRVMEADFRTLVKETVNTESKLYPRTTAVNRFLQPPYSIPVDLLPELVKDLLDKKEESIESCSASNGAIHLFNPELLVRAQAEYLAEWEEVECFECE